MPYGVLAAHLHHCQRAVHHWRWAVVVMRRGGGILPLPFPPGPAFLLTPEHPPPGVATPQYLPSKSPPQFSDRPKFLRHLWHQFACDCLLFPVCRTPPRRRPLSNPRGGGGALPPTPSSGCPPGLQLPIRSPYFSAGSCWTLKNTVQAPVAPGDHSGRRRPQRVGRGGICTGGPTCEGGFAVPSIPLLRAVQGWI